MAFHQASHPALSLGTRTQVFYQTPTPRKSVTHSHPSLPTDTLTLKILGCLHSGHPPGLLTFGFHLTSSLWASTRNLCPGNLPDTLTLGFQQ